MQASGITVEHMQGSLALLRALPMNSQKIVFALVRMQLVSSGATYADLHSYGRQHYLVTSDAALKNILVSACLCVARAELRLTTVPRLSSEITRCCARARGLMARR